MTVPLNDMDKELLGEKQNLAGGVTDGVSSTADAEMIDAAVTDGDTSFTPINGVKDTGAENDDAGQDAEKEPAAAAAKPIPKTTPKKRGAKAPTNDTNASPSKKRSPTKAAASKMNDTEMKDGPAASPTPKKKATATPKKQIKQEQDEMDTAADVLLAAADITPEKPKRTPKGKAQAQTQSKSTNGDGSSINDTPTKSTAETEDSASPEKKNGKPRQRAAPVAGKVAGSMPIPHSWDDAGAADRMLVTMKNEGKDWASIRSTWSTMTGQETGASTLPNRYARIKDNMMRLAPGDDKILLASKNDIEKAFETEKWALIAANMATRGAAEKYSTAFMQKQVKILEAKGGLAALELEGSDADVADGLGDGLGEEAGKDEAMDEENGDE